jgi:trimeric autotransporter adhesin
LADLGIVSMDLQAQAGTEMDHGNLLGLTSSYTTTDGQSHDMADVWFAKEVPADGTSVALTITDVLIDPGHSDALAAVSGSSDPATVKQDGVSASSGSTPVAATDDVAAQTVVLDPTKGLLMDQNNNPLI